MLFLDFFMEKRKTGEKTGEISANSCSFLRFLCLFAVFWFIFLVFFCSFSLVFEENRAPSGGFLCRFLYFFRGIAVFYLLFSFSDFWFSVRKTKTVIFKQNNDEKRNIWKIVPVFLFSVFCSGYFYMNFCVFCENHV